MPRQRIDEYVIEGMDEVTFNTEPAWVAPVIATPTSVALDSIKSAQVEDPTSVVDGGERAMIAGPSFSQIAVPASFVAQGVRTSPALGNPPDETLVAKMLKTVTQGTVVAHDTDTIAAAPAPSATGFTVNTSGSHDLTGVGCVAFEYSGKYYSRPCTVAADAVSLLMAAPGVPVAGDDLPGGLLFPYVQTPSTLQSMAYRFLGNDDLQHASIQGSVAALSMPAAGPQDLTMLEFTLSGGGFDENFVDTRPASTDPAGRTMTGGEILMAVYGQTAYLAICGRIAMPSMRKGWLADTCITPDGSGIASWSPAKGAFELELQIPHSLVPTDFTGGTDADWPTAFRNGTEFHLFVTDGLGTPGRGFSRYFRRLILKSQPTRGELDEQDFRTLRLAPATGYNVSTEAPAVFHMW